MTPSQKPLTAPQQKLFDALQAGAVCHYMRYAGSFNPVPYYFCTAYGGRVTKQVDALLARGLAEKFNVTKYGEHSIRIKPSAMDNP